jgi:hypothetical protein
VGKERITKILTAEDRIQLQLLTKGEKKRIPYFLFKQ